MTDHDALERVAVAAARAGAAELERRFRAGDAAGDYGAHDVKAEADEAAEAAMLPVVRAAFPDHAVFAEEAGRFPGGEYRWILDPLDGTNNFAAGLPAFASSVAVERAGEPLFAVVVLPATGELYVARRGEGVRYGGEQMTAANDVELPAGTVALIVGREVPRDPGLAEEAAAVESALADSVKRVLDSWAPTVHSGLFARGRLQGIVQFHPDEEEQTVTELFAREAGAAVRRSGRLFVAADGEADLEALWAALDAEGAVPD